MGEFERLENDSKHHLPEIGLAIIIKPELESDTLDRLKEMLKSIISIEKSDLNTDEFWESSLPDWFVSKTKNIPEVELLNNSQLWDFGSWIDAIKHRGWKWWSYKNTKDKTILYLETFSYPYNIDSFFYILYCIGVDFNRTEILEIYPDSKSIKIV